MILLTTFFAHRTYYLALFCFLQTEESKLEGVSGLVQALPEYIQASASANASSAASSGPRGSKKDTSFSMPVRYVLYAYRTHARYTIELFVYIVHE